MATRRGAQRGWDWSVLDTGWDHKQMVAPPTAGVRGESQGGLTRGGKHPSKWMGKEMENTGASVLPKTPTPGHKLQPERLLWAEGSKTKGSSRQSTNLY